jgi:hypothetical protein
MVFLWGFFAGVATMIVMAITFSFVVFFLTPDEMEEEFALRVRDLPGSVPNPRMSVPESNMPMRLADRKSA